MAGAGGLGANVMYSYAGAARFILYACFVGSALAFGGIQVETNVFVAAAAVLALGLCVLDRWSPWSALWQPAGLACALAAVATVLHMVPLPTAWMQWLSPATHAVYVAALRDRYQGGSISTDIPASAHELLKLIAALAVILVARRLWRGRSERRTLYLVISASGALIGLIGHAHVLLGQHLTFGLFGPDGMAFPSPFINGNHAAAYLGLSFFLSLGLLVDQRSSGKGLVAACAFLSGTAFWFTLSRAAALILSVCLGLFCVSTWWSGRARGRRSGRSPRVALWIAMGAVCVTAAGVTLNYQEFRTEAYSLLREGQVAEKTQAWPVVPAMLRDYELFGVGRGAFRTTYPRYAQTLLMGEVQRLENEWLQTLVDWGPWIGGLILLGIVAAWGRALTLVHDSPLRQAAVLGLLFVGTHNLADYSLALSAVLLPAAALLSLSSTRKGSGGRDAVAAPMAYGWALWVACAAGVLVSGLLGFGKDLRNSDRPRLRSVLASKTQWPRKVEQAQVILDRHPSDAFLYVSMAHAALRDAPSPREALRWVGSALYLNPQSHYAHWYTAQALWRLGNRKQALLEYRQTLERIPPKWEGTEGARVIQDVLHVGATTKDLRALVGTADWANLFIARHLLNASDCAGALEAVSSPTLDHRAEALDTRAGCHLSAGEPARALAEALEAERLTPNSSATYQYLWQAYDALGRPEEAQAALVRGIQMAQYPWGLMGIYVSVQLNQNKEREAIDAIRTKMDQGGAEGAAEGSYQLGRVHEHFGKNTQAAAAYETACAKDPSRQRNWLGAARMRLRLGQLASGLRQLERASESIQADPEIRKVREEMETALQVVKAVQP